MDQTNMITLTLDPALAHVISLAEYPNIAPHVVAGRFPFPATNAQLVEMDKFLRAAAAASTRDRIHVAAYAAYIKGGIIVSGSCESQS